MLRVLASLITTVLFQPFNIQDEFHLPNFTFEQVQRLTQQYTEEVGQNFSQEVVKRIHTQTGGQPFLVNRFGQILTEELEIPKTESITTTHFAIAYQQLLDERNTNIEHLLTNIRRDRRYENKLMQITSYEKGHRYNLNDPIVNELATFGVIARGDDGMCEIVNPIYKHRIIQAFKPTITDWRTSISPKRKMNVAWDFLTPTGDIDIEAVLDNFRDFIARVGFRILQVPDTPQEYVGQLLLYAYLEHFILT